MDDPKPIAIVRHGCGWLVLFSDGYIRCVNRATCPGPHEIEARS